MYQEKMAAAIKVNGRVLREDNDTVFIPFGSEYQIHLKNLNSVRALVSIQIDGQDATEGTRLIVPANGTVDIERFIKNNNLSEGQRFKFIERTAKIENGPRGIKAEDGLIRIEFEFEREPAKIIPSPIYGPFYGGTKEEHHHHYHYDRYTKLIGTSDWQPKTGDIWCSAQSTSAMVNNASMSYDAAPVSSTKSLFRSAEPKELLQEVRPQANDKGITVGGSVSDQKFTQGAWFATDGVKHVMVLKVLGEVAGKKVKQAVTVKTKQECPTCGTKNKAGTKFCRECGTGLQLV